MYWDEQLYVGRSCKRRVDKLKKSIAQRKAHSGVYLIVRSTTPGCLFEIVPSMLLLQPLYPIDDMHVIGIAGYRLECEDLLIRIVQEMYDEGRLSA